MARDGDIDTEKAAKAETKKEIQNETHKLIQAQTETETETEVDDTVDATTIHRRYSLQAYTWEAFDVNTC